MSVDIEVNSRKNKSDDSMKESNSVEDQFDYSSIPEAATFQPSEKEFVDPLAYINNIRPIAEKYGICKIIPPRRWRPSFCLDMKSFKFTPRVQRLNELEAGTRIKILFLEKLSKFWELQGNKFRIPIVERKPLDVFQLHKTVEAMGGFEYVAQKKRWAKISKLMGFKEPGTARIIKCHFEKLLYPYILFEAGVTLPITSRNETKLNENDDDDDDDDDDDNDEQNDETHNKRKSNSKKFNKIKSSKLSYNDEKIESIKCLVCDRGDDEGFILLCDGCDDSYHTYCLYPPLKEIPKGDWRCPNCIAEICKKPTDSYGFEPSKKHYCLNEFGEMANKFKTSYFNKKYYEVSSEEVEREFWRILSSPDEDVNVEYGADLHTIDTGSGFPSRTYAKGKTISSNFDDYIDSPWNLNNLALLDKSVLSQMNVEISGMKIPWAYVGMCFSCFCWHVEDHWSYSINYLHWGETKTWYGVSGNDAENFEEVMKQNAKELFDKSPDLLHHLVTIMNPKILLKSRVPIYKINQKAGEFVVTFPRAYHAGFNQGFNFAEAVNFCPADWLSIGRAAIEHYKLVKRNTVFSHDELIFKLATTKEPLDIDIIVATEKELARIVEYEQKNRKELIKKGIKNLRRTAFELLNDDERTCAHCRTTCFVSALVCTCDAEKLVCLNHYQHLCEKAFNSKPTNSHQLFLLFRYSMEEIYEIHSNLKQRCSHYDLWCTNAQNVLAKTEPNDNLTKKAKVKLNFVLNLLEEAKMNKYPCVMSSSTTRAKSWPEKQPKDNSRRLQDHSKSYLFKQLEKEFEKANTYALVCTKIISFFKLEKKKSKLDIGYCNKAYDTREIELDDSFDEDESESEENENGLQEIDTFSALSDDYKEILLIKKSIRRNGNKRVTLDQLKIIFNGLNNLVCEIEEAELFETLFEEAIQNEEKLEKLVAEWNIDSPSCLKNVLIYLNNVCIQYPPRIHENLRLMYKQSVWLNNVKFATDNPAKLTLDRLKSLMDKVLEYDLLRWVETENKNQLKVQKHFIELQRFYSLAQSWDNKIRVLLKSNSSSDIVSLEKTLNKAKAIPVKMESIDMLEKTVQEAQKIAKLINEHKSKNKLFHLTDLDDILKTAKDLPFKVEQIDNLKAKVKLVDEWKYRLIDSFLTSKEYIDDSTNEPNNLIEVLVPRMDLVSIINRLKIQNNLSKSPSNSHMTASSSTNMDSKQSYTLKRNKNKFSAASNFKSSESEALITSIECPLALFKDRNLNSLKEKFKLLQLRELEQIKQIRSLNVEKLKYILSQIALEVEDYSRTNQKTQSAETASSSAETPSSSSNQNQPQEPVSNPYAETNNNVRAKLNSLPNSCLKCCSCAKSMLSAFHSNSFLQCKLCLGLYHLMCKNSPKKLTNSEREHMSIPLCSMCKRSKRPRVEAVFDLLISFDGIEINSIEGYALQLFSNRCLNWQEKVKKLFNYNDVKQLNNLANRILGTKPNQLNDIVQSDKLVQDFKKTYSSMSVPKKTELSSLYLDGLLIESELVELTSLNQINSLADYFFNEDLYDNLKSKLRKTLTNQLDGDFKANKSMSKKNSKKNGLSLNSKLKTDSNQVIKVKIKAMANGKALKKTSLDSALRKESSTIDASNRDSYDLDDSSEDICAAFKCLEPSGGNIKWVQCDGDCNRWFHMACVGITKIRKKESYLCTDCTEKNSKESIDIKTESMSSQTSPKVATDSDTTDKVGGREQELTVNLEGKHKSDDDLDTSTKPAKRLKEDNEHLPVVELKSENLTKTQLTAS